MRKYILIVFVFFVAGCASNDKKASTSETVVDEGVNGETLYKSNCASCHKPDKDFTGPVLKGALKRWDGDKKAMYDFIRNPPKSYVENAYAKKLLEKWNNTQMTAFPTLNDRELDAVMNYVENYKATR